MTASSLPGSIGTHSATSAIPALPGAQNSFVRRGLALKDQASACSRPPEPRRRTFIRSACCNWRPGVASNAEQTRRQPLSSTPDTSEGRPGANAPEYSVSELSNAIKRALEDGFGYVRLRGEI